MVPAYQSIKTMPLSMVCSKVFSVSSIVMARESRAPHKGFAWYPWEWQSPTLR